MSKNLNKAGKNNDSVLTPSSMWQPWVDFLAPFVGPEVFTLDPCGCARQDVIASRTVHLPNNGLELSWIGERVWLNPPYSQLQYPKKYPWLEKAACEADLAIAFIPARTSSKWFVDAVASSRRLWFLYERVVHKHAPLCKKTGRPMGAPFAQSFLVFSRDEDQRLLQPPPLNVWGW